MTRQMLGELFRRYEEFNGSNHSDALERYRRQDIVKYLEEHPEMVRDYEGFHIPEITMLICSSDILINQEWASQYLIVRDFFICKEYEWTPSTVSHILEQGENSIRLLADDKVYKKIQLLKANAEEEAAKCKDNVEALATELIDAQKECNDRREAAQKKNTVRDSKDSANDNLEGDSLEGNTSVLAENNQVGMTEQVDANSEGKKEKRKITSKRKVASNKETKRIKRIRELQQEADKQQEAADYRLNLISQLFKIVENAQPEFNKKLTGNRQSAYDKVDISSVPMEETIFKGLINSGEVTSVVRDFFKDSSQCNRFVRLLQRVDHIDYACELIAFLFQEGVIDLVCVTEEEQQNNEFYLFLKKNPEYFVEYLLHHFPQLYTEITANEDYYTLLQIAVDSDINKAQVGNEELEYNKLWNCIEDPDVWNWIFTEAEKIGVDNFESVVSAFGRNAQGRVANAFISSLESRDISLGRIIKELLAFSGCNNRELISLISNRIDQANKKMQRQINSANRKLDEQAGRIFSELYDPVQAIEELTINISTSKQEIPNSLIAAQLTDIVKRIREGLSGLNVYPLESFDTWKNQSVVNYDGEIHRYEAGESANSKSIRVNTMGFKYEERGREEKHFSKVIAAIEEEEQNDGV